MTFHNQAGSESLTLPTMAGNAQTYLETRAGAVYFSVNLNGRKRKKKRKERKKERKGREECGEKQNKERKKREKG